MIILNLFIALILTLLATQPRPASDAVKRLLDPADVCLSAYETELYNVLNDYRVKHRLPPIVLSRSLTFVAQLHCRDLAINQPHSRSNCNMHSWSSKGSWSACCYTPDHKRSECMWKKPGELSVYTGDGFEIAFHSTANYANAREFAEDAIETWSKSKGHNDVILNRNTWKNIQWKAIGVGFFDGYATVWFGMLDDPDTNPMLSCP